MEFFRKDIIPNNTTIYIGGPEMLKRPTTIKVYCFGVDNKEIEMFITKGRVAFVYNNQEKLEFTYDEFKNYCEKIKETIDPFIVFAYEFYACEWKLGKSGNKGWKTRYPRAIQEAKENVKKFPGVNIDFQDLIKGGFKMGEMDDLIESFQKNTKKIVDESTQPLKDKINDLVDLNQELVSSNQELMKEIDLLRNKKNIPVQLFLDIKKNNPNLSDKEALALAKQQINDLGELS